MDRRDLSQKLTDARLAVLEEFPFFGRLLMRLPFGIADCETAFTDMRRIVFDPRFARRLSPQEVQYVLVHEVLHCVLKHCTRSVGKHRFLYNVACDIVVNSMILEMYRMEELVIDGAPLMHVAPNGREGREHTAEEIYAMFASDREEGEQGMEGSGIDTHEVWGEIGDATLEEDWDHYVRDAVATCGVGSGIPKQIARYLKEIDRTPRTNWRQILHDFIQHDRCDYNLMRPDRRYSEVFLPSFSENMDGAAIEKLWFLVDTSGSVSDNALSVAYYEVQQAVEQIDHVSGMLSFFDYNVSDPTPFETLEDILSIKPVGGGGTSFRAIFKKLAEYAEEGELPNVMVIITDGYATFPAEEDALGVPVIWLIVDSSVEPPWGAYAFIST